MRGTGLELDQLDAELRLEDGEARLERFEALYQGGKLSARGEIREQPGPSAVALHLRASGLRVGTLLAQFQEKPELTGVLDLAADLRARGPTLDALLASLDGDLALMVREGKARSRYLREFELDVVKALASVVVSKEFEELECLIVDLRAQRGVAEAQALYLETERIQLMGSGSLDLGARTFDLRLTPRPKRRGPIAVAPSVRVEGPFTDPSFRVVKRSLATSALRSLFGSIARTGDPVVHKFWQRQGGESGPCADAFEAWD